MCRSIKPLRRYSEIATAEEVEAAALQFVRKVSGYRKPSPANAPAFDAAVARIAAETEVLLAALASAHPSAKRDGSAEAAAIVRVQFPQGTSKRGEDRRDRPRARVGSEPA